MAVFQTGSLQLPNELVGSIIKGISDESVVAKLAPATARGTILNDQYTVLTAEPELEFVAESENKPNQEIATAPVITQTHKAVGTLRFSQEVMWADEDTQLELFSTSIEVLARAGARALDYGILHAVSPHSGSAITGATALVTAANQKTATADPRADMDSFPDAVIEGGFEFNGIALAPTYANTLRKVRNADGQKLFPEIGLSLRDASTVDGVTAAVSSTVNGSAITPATGIQAIGGDWSLIRWGIVREIQNELIQYGDPDGLGDLKRKNEVALRYEVMYKWAVIDPLGFSVLKTQSA